MTQVSELQGLDDAGVRLGEEQLASYLNILSHFTQSPSGLMALSSAVDRSVTRVMKGYNEAARVSAADVVVLMDEVVRDAEVQGVVQAALRAVADSAEFQEASLRGAGCPEDSQGASALGGDDGSRGLDEPRPDGSAEGGGRGGHGEEDVAEDARTGACGFSSIISATCATLRSREALSRVHSSLSSAVSLISSNLTAALIPPPGGDAAASPLPPSPPPCGGPQPHCVDGTPPGGDMSKSLSPAASLQEDLSVVVDSSAASPSWPLQPCFDDFDWAAGVSGARSTPLVSKNVRDAGGWGVYEEGAAATPCLSEDGEEAEEVEEVEEEGGGLTLDITRGQNSTDVIQHFKAPANTPASAQAAYTTPVITCASLSAPASGGHSKQQLFKGGIKDSNMTTVFKLVPVMSGVFGKVCSAADGAAGNPFVPLLGPVL